MEVLREGGCAAHFRVRSRVSILVLMEVLREVAASRSWNFRIHICFNPCFNGSVERGHLWRLPQRRQREVSILVLMEVLREARAILEGSPDPTRVSILVLMEVLREDREPVYCGPRVVAVSILVLMEVLREVGDGARHLDSIPRFNPCFNGSVERGRGQPRNEIGADWFQSLF